MIPIQTYWLFRFLVEEDAHYGLVLAKNFHLGASQICSASVWRSDSSRGFYVQIQQDLQLTPKNLHSRLMDLMVMRWSSEMTKQSEGGINQQRCSSHGKKSDPRTNVLTLHFWATNHIRRVCVCVCGHANVCLRVCLWVGKQLIPQLPPHRSEAPPQAWQNSGNKIKKRLQYQEKGKVFHYFSGVGGRRVSWFQSRST